jgi:DNA-binding response OmpR family regulator
MEQQTILLVEDDQNLSFLLKKNLEEEGYSVVTAVDGEDGWDKFNGCTVDMCILDVMLPQQDGFTLASMIRGKSRVVPILFLTAKTMREDMYRGFELGGDDYMTKPFTARELLLRTRAILRRANPEVIVGSNSMSFSIGKMTFDHALRQLTHNGVIKNLSTKESELLRIFCESRNTVVNRSRLLVEVWGRDDYFVSKSLDVYITRLRKLLKDDPDISIQNYHSFGYKMIVRETVV